MDVEVLPKTVNLTIYRGDDVDVLVKLRLAEELDISDISFAMVISFGTGQGVVDVPSGAFTWEAGSDGEAGNLLIKFAGDFTAQITSRVFLSRLFGGKQTKWGWQHKNTFLSRLFGGKLSSLP